MQAPSKKEACKSITKITMRINILVLGKSGAGKSTLLNYLYGEKLAETGVGQPVTKKSDGKQSLLYEHKPIKEGKNELVIFDSWGMEADKATEWVQLITEESKKRESSGDVEKWFHAVIYCVSSAGARIEDFELHYIIKNLQESGHTVVFALTKAGRASDQEKQSLRKAIEDNTWKIGGIIDIESISETRRSGQKTDQTGRNELVKMLTRNLENNLRKKLAAQYLEKCQSILIEWKKESLAHYDKDPSFFRSVAESIPQDFIIFTQKNMKRHLNYLDLWCRAIEEKIEHLQSAFTETLGYSNSKNRAIIKIHESISDSEIESEISDQIASILTHMILPFAFFLTKSLFRDTLEKKLDSYASKFMEQANTAAEICRDSGRFN